MHLSMSGCFFENRQEARKLGPVSKPNASINQPAQRARGGGSMSFACGGGDASPGNCSRGSVRRVFSRDNPTLMISTALFGLIFFVLFRFWSLLQDIF